LAYLAISLGLRLLIQLRTTGSSGFALAKSKNRLEILASTLFVSSLFAGLASPILALALPEQPLWRAHELAPVVTAIGGLLYVCGVTLAFTSQLTLGKSWRIGVDVNERTELIERGAFKVVRNPIFSALQLTAVSLALVCSTPLAWLACGVQFIALQLQVRGVEEPHLTRMHGDAYLDYTARVGRFVPGLGLRPRAVSGARVALIDRSAVSPRHTDDIRQN
jgi:protein-S-isoprenylcysteine O-methyltransferase Ste14